MSSAEIKHACGLFGIQGHPDAAALTHLGLFAQQHRGQESAGICTTAGPNQPIQRHTGLGLVQDVFSGELLRGLRNPVAIGHVRYSTTGSCSNSNTQPLLFQYAGGQVAIAHNGNLVNATALRQQYEQQGHIFSTTSDTEIISHLLANPAHVAQASPLALVLRQLKGAFSLLFLFRGQIVAARDPEGFRPLCIGRLPGGAHVVASETCALDIIDAEYLRDVMPGELVTFGGDGVQSECFAAPGPRRVAQCVFEHVYFADPASSIFGQNVHQARTAMGRQLAREAPVGGDLVIAVPNCARCAAIGYSQESGIPLERGFTTSHYAGRSFIMPEQHMRDLAVKMKLNVIKEVIRGQRIVVIEDSVVRGTTTRGKMGALRTAGAVEIHLRVASPPIRHGCYYGIDFPDKSKLAAHEHSIEDIRRFLEVDSLAYLSLEGMLSCVSGGAAQYCTACFSGEYPVPVDHTFSKYALECQPAAPGMPRDGLRS